MLFSIIIPVYNTKKFLRDCIDSLESQTLKDFEIIIVDDGSTDGSSSLCDNLPSLYPDLKFKIIHQENSGQIAARYKGIDNATGEYCLFLDSDDFFKENTIKELGSALSKDPVDMLIFNGLVYKEGERPYPFWPHFSDKPLLMENEQLNHFYSIVLSSDRFNNICFKAIKLDVLQKSHRYNNVTKIRIDEDYLMQLPIFDQTKSILYVPFNLYYYRSNMLSITHGSFYSFRFEGSKYIYREKMYYGRKWGIKDFKEISNRFFMQRTVMAIRQLRNYDELSRKGKIKYLEKIQRDALFREQYKQFDGKVNSKRARIVLWLLYNGFTKLTLFLVEHERVSKK